MIHEHVRNLRAILAEDYVVTTDEVLTELLTYFASRGFAAREQTTKFVRSLLDSSVEVIPQSRDSFLKGLELYEMRSDSLPDCISMQTMKAFNLTEALTHDHHFAQEGFITILGRYIH